MFEFPANYLFICNSSRWGYDINSQNSNYIPNPYLRLCLALCEFPRANWYQFDSTSSFGNVSHIYGLID